MSHSTHSRNREFIRRCMAYQLDEARRGRALTADMIVGHVLAGRAPVYYVDFYRAKAILSRALADNREPRGTYDGPRRQWADMYRDLCDMIARNPDRPLDNMIMQLCVGNAGQPRFYITRRRAMQILRQHINENL
ncbi:MAG: hypothetical protein Q4C34_03870 [Bacteroidales bacterium]|nr:hypothetical protein [Bacteroidales bacterium]